MADEIPGVCDACGCVMKQADGCSAVPYVNAFRYGGEPIFSESDEWEPQPRCYDCGALVGFHHHLDCLCARCTTCGDQAVMCEHNVYEVDGEP